MAASGDQGVVRVDREGSSAGMSDVDDGGYKVPEEEHNRGKLRVWQARGEADMAGSDSFLRTVFKHM